MRSDRMERRRAAQLAGRVLFAALLSIAGSERAAAQANFRMPDIGAPNTRKVNDVKADLENAGLKWEVVSKEDRAAAKNSTVIGAVPMKDTQLTAGEIVHLVVDPLGKPSSGAWPYVSAVLLIVSIVLGLTVKSQKKQIEDLKGKVGRA